MKFYINKKTFQVFAYENNFIIKDNDLTDKLELQENGEPYPKYSGEKDSNGIYLHDKTHWGKIVQEREFYEKKEQDRKLKYDGKEYELNGKVYKISFTKEDQNMFLAVDTGFNKNIFSSTNMDFSNGTRVPINNIEDFNALVEFWAPIRNSFFK